MCVCVCVTGNPAYEEQESRRQRENAESNRNPTEQIAFDRIFVFGPCSPWQNTKRAKLLHLVLLFYRCEDRPMQCNHGIKSNYFYFFFSPTILLSEEQNWNECLGRRFGNAMMRRTRKFFSTDELNAQPTSINSIDNVRSIPKEKIIVFKLMAARYVPSFQAVNAISMCFRVAYSEQRTISLRKHSVCPRLIQTIYEFFSNKLARIEMKLNHLNSQMPAMASQ